MYVLLYYVHTPYVLVLNGSGSVLLETISESRPRFLVSSRVGLDQHQGLAVSALTHWHLDVPHGPMVTPGRWDHQSRP